MLAVIDEPRCIGCTLCQQVCPVDAILGASKYLHTIIAQECIGCKLCIPSCPVDCIVLSNDSIAQQRRKFRDFRLARDKKEQAVHYQQAITDHKKRATIKAAIDRVLLIQHTVQVQSPQVLKPLPQVIQSKNHLN